MGNESKLNVLVVDDDPVCTFINCKTIELSGFFNQIYTASNGQNALKFFDRNDEAELPDVVFLDIDMPIMNGFQFIEAFQLIEFPGKEKLSIIILTSSDHQEDKQRATKMGVQNYLIKPITLKTLKQIFG